MPDQAYLAPRRPRPSRARRGRLTVEFANGVVAHVEGGAWTADDGDPVIARFLDGLTRDVEAATLTYHPDWDLALPEHAAQVLGGRVVDTRPPVEGDTP